MSASTTADNLIYEFGPFRLDPHARRLLRNGELVTLAASEFELLLLLVRNRGRVVEKSEIMAQVWPDVEVEENNLTVRMSSLRRALGETKGYHPYIQTVTGRGYCLITQVNVVSAQTNKFESDLKIAPVVREPFRPPASARRKFKRIRLYALLLIPVLFAGILYAILRWQRRSAPPDWTQSVKMTRVTHTGRVGSAAISPDGKTIAYVELNGELSSLRVQRAGTNNPLEIVAPVKSHYRDPAFSPDGNTLYYSKCQPSCKLHKIPVLGGVETELRIRADCPVTFSPDGKRIAYLRTGALPGVPMTTGLFIANADGSNEQEIHVLTDPNAYQRGTPAWSPDGKTIAFSIISNEEGRRFMKVLGIGIGARRESTLTSQRWRYIGDVSWSPDGNSLIINGRDKDSEASMQIWHVPLTGGEPRRITNDLNTYLNVALSNDGNTLLAAHVVWTSGLWTASAENPADGGPLTHGTIDRRDGNMGLAIMPDGRVIYTSDLSGKRDIWSVNADGSGLKQLTDALHSDIYPIVTPDGRYIVFESARDGAYNLWRVDADGRNPIRLTSGSRDDEPMCSPDGKWIVYVTETSSRVPMLRKVPIEGGDSVPVTDEFAQHPTISPDGKLIAYHRIDQQRKRWVVIIPAEGGSPIKVMPIPKNFGSVMRWTPEGDAIAYQENTMGGLWKMPIDGTAPSQLLDLRGDRLHYFRYSHDGRRLVYASGPNLTDVILITKLN